MFSIEEDMPMLKLAEEEAATTQENNYCPPCIELCCNKNALVTLELPSACTSIYNSRSK